jgi:hypothetical protein
VISFGDTGFKVGFGEGVVGAALEMTFARTEVLACGLGVPTDCPTEEVVGG